MTYGINASINVNKKWVYKNICRIQNSMGRGEDSLHTDIDYTIWGSDPKVSVILFLIILHWSGRTIMQSKDLTVLKYDFS